MPGLQDALVAVFALGALGLVTARIVKGLRPSAKDDGACPHCASGDPCAPEPSKPASSSKAH